MFSGVYMISSSLHVRQVFDVTVVFRTLRSCCMCVVFHCWFMTIKAVMWWCFQNFEKLLYVWYDFIGSFMTLKCGVTVVFRTLRSCCMACASSTPWFRSARSLALWAGTLPTASTSLTCVSQSDNCRLAHM